MDSDSGSNDYDDNSVQNNCQNFDGDSRPRKKTKRSIAWDYYDKIGVAEDGKEKCKCKGCGKVYTCGSRVGTSVLLNHIPKCSKPFIVGRKEPGIGSVEEDRSGPRRKLDQKVVRELTTRLIIQHDLPCQFVERDGFKEFAKYISSDEVQCVSRDVAAADVMKVYLAEKDKLMTQLDGISGKVCLSFNRWTSDNTNCGYFALAAHYVDDDWKLNSKLLDFFDFEDYDLDMKVLKCIKKWGIIEKIFSMTFDASASENIHIFRKDPVLCNGLLTEAKFIPIKCCAQVLDCIAQEGLKVVELVLQKIREGVKDVSQTESMLRVFFDCVKEVGGIDTRDGLHLDVSGSWKAAYMMLKSAVKYRHAFCCFHAKLSADSDSSLDEEWTRGLRRAEKICELLTPFYNLTHMVSGAIYPTSDAYLKEIWAIEIQLKENKLSEDDMISNMASKMLLEFERYLSEHSKILAISCVLDPRLKFRFVEHIYSEVDSNAEIVQEKLADVRKTLYALFNEYSNQGPSTSSDSSKIDSGLSSPTHNKRKRESNLPALFFAYEESKRLKAYAAGKTELDLYLEEPNLPNLNFDALDYWKNKGHGFGTLRKMARDVLSIPLFTVVSDSAFSIGRDIFRKYRNCTLSKNLRAHICSRNWLFGFSRDRLGDVTEETKIFDVNFSEQDLNDIAFDESENANDGLED